MWRLKCHCCSIVVSCKADIVNYSLHCSLFFPLGSLQSIPGLQGTGFQISSFKSCAHSSWCLLQQNLTLKFCETAIMACTVLGILYFPTMKNNLKGGSPRLGTGAATIQSVVHGGNIIIFSLQQTHHVTDVNTLHMLAILKKIKTNSSCKIQKKKIQQLPKIWVRAFLLFFFTFSWKRNQFASQ